MAAEGRSSIRRGTSSAEAASGSPAASASQPQPRASPPAAPPRGRPCRFYGQPSGCRAGAQCPFAHDASQRVAAGQPAKARPARQRPPGSADPERGEASAAAPSALPNTTPTQRAVARPTPRAQQDDPREFQLAQIRRRFGAAESREASGGATVLAFGMKPSDPDFPFAIDALQCRLRVPATFPDEGRPSLSVSNPEMDRGFQLNVERGFAALQASLPAPTLLGLMNALDRQLEELLTAPPAETFSIKIVPNAAARAVPERGEHGEHAAAAVPTAPPPVVVQPAPAQLKERPPPPQPTYSPEETSHAKARRDQETRQLEARLGRLPQFSTLAGGAFIVPVDPRRGSSLPVALQAIKTVKLLVPERYPLQPCRVELMGIDRQDALPVQQAFEDRAGQFAQMSLLNHVNYFSQNMHSMAQAPPARSEKRPDAQGPGLEGQGQAAEAEASVPVGTDSTDDKSHIITIPRPPEWMAGRGSDNDDDDDDDDDSSYDSCPDESDRDGEAEGGGSDRPGEGSQTPAPERGITLSLPHLELYGIELLELVNLCLTIKCTRCKDTMDIKNLKNNANADYTGVRNESCKKCANPLGIGYRMDLMHANSVRAGYLDLDGCTPVDMLPRCDLPIGRNIDGASSVQQEFSCGCETIARQLLYLSGGYLKLPCNFLPTCSGCSAQYSDPGVVSVRGDSAMAICRECHKKMTFRIAEVKFLLVSASSAQAARALPRKKAKEKLGIVAGQELPRRGRCKHYSKSNRWFRFSCCAKVYPCDRCHDDEADHPNEHANRMICGFCSREQNYRPGDCGICHATLIGKKGTGYWEGGKGTRDRTRMSRKDPRKHKRRPGTKPSS